MMNISTSSLDGREVLYPEIDVAHTESWLSVGDGHEVFYEICGNPAGVPVVVVHGGPGGGSNPYYRQFFDPSFYRIVNFDQRGCGKSRPHASLHENNTWKIIGDMETLRMHLGIEKWALFGGSWGACLSLAYAQTHPSRVLALVLRGVFTLRKVELEWFYQIGANGNEMIFPEAFEALCEPIPVSEQRDIIGAYYRRLTGSNDKERVACARTWSVYEMTTSRLFVDPEYISRAADDDAFALAFARIETHYFVHGGWFEKEDQLVKGAKILEESKIPGFIVQGRYDVSCMCLNVALLMAYALLLVCLSCQNGVSGA